MVLQEVCDCESSGLMSHGAACPAPPAADATSPAAGLLRCCMRVKFKRTGRSRCLEKIRISGKQLKNAGTEFRRDDTMTVRVLPRCTRSTIEFIVRRHYLVWFGPILCPPIVLTAVLRTRSSYIHQDWLGGYKVN